MPRFQDTRKFKLTSKVLKSSDMLKNLFTSIRDHLLRQQASVRWPRHRLPHKPPASVRVSSLPRLLVIHRRWLCAHVIDFANESRSLAPVEFGPVGFSQEEIDAFGGAPLSLHSFVRQQPKPPLGEAGSALEAALPQLDAHGAADHPMARAVLTRLRDDLAQYEQVTWLMSPGITP